MVEKLTKSGKPDKRYKAKEGGKIQEIIDSGQAPGVSIPVEHQSAPKNPKRGGTDWSHLNCNGVTARTKKGN